ncbi:GNAT family N-acetyltransferase [Nonomuraea sp. NPDC001023]|uniref:GNAT family N-acetyltransferase n=1 Tax=unclassified Nonomuraea TaxID=2593643 RepID=UPI0033265CAE
MVADVHEWLTDTVHRRRLDGEGVHLAIVEQATGEIVGSVGLRDTDWEAGRTEIGYGIHTGQRGRGYATEAARGWTVGARQRWDTACSAALPHRQRRFPTGCREGRIPAGGHRAGR